MCYQPESASKIDEAIGIFEDVPSLPTGNHFIRWGDIEAEHCLGCLCVNLRKRGPGKEGFVRGLRRRGVVKGSSDSPANLMMMEGVLVDRIRGLGPVNDDSIVQHGPQHQYKQNVICLLSKR